MIFNPDEQEISEMKQEEIVEEKQNRFRSWAVWVSVAGAVWIILQAFGLIETAEKAAEIYIKIVGIGIKQSITAKNLKELAVAFDVKPNWDFIE